MVAGKDRNAGQVCVSPTRFLVEEDVFEKFRDGFAQRAKAIRVGSGFDAQTQMGPMASQRGPDGLQAKIAAALGKGAKLLAGGNRIGNQGFFHAPTVLSEVPLDATIMNEERAEERRGGKEWVRRW